MKNTGNIALIISLIVATVLIYQSTTGRHKKIAVLQLHDVIYDFQGMKDATEKYTEKMNQWSKQSNTLEDGLKELIQEIKLDSINNDQEKLQKDYQVFLLKRQTFFDYKQKVEQMAAEEDNKMTIGVMNQLRSYIKDFAEQEYYDAIIVETEQKAMTYVNEATDVTSAFLGYANEKYIGE